MEIYLKKYGKSTLLTSILLVILSIFIIFRPHESISIVVRILGLVLLITGSIHTISYFSTSKEFKSFSMELVLGVVSLGAGILLMINPNIVLGILPVAFGCWIIIESIIRIQFTFKLKAMGSQSWKVLLPLSILTLILGVVMVFNPFAALNTVVVISGVMLLVTELINIFESIYVLRT
ncbi:MAG: DUF308 domain-containing protein [Clostridia bacterium]